LSGRRWKTSRGLKVGDSVGENGRVAVFFFPVGAEGE